MILSEQLEEIELRGSLMEWAEVRRLIESDDIKKRTIKVLRKFSLFDFVQQEWEHFSSPDPMQIEVYLTKGGEYLGARHQGKRPGLIRAIEKYGIQAERVSDEHCVCSIGKGKDGKWWGWSHRAMVGFGKGDRVFDEDYGDDETPFVKHGKKVINTDDDAKTAAIKFARSVS